MREGSRHAELVASAAAWLRTHGCAVVITEAGRADGEMPDVIGWAGGGRSTLVECKASRADFLADEKLVFRRAAATGIGSLRYYCAPSGMLGSDEMPAGWGLLEWDGNRMTVSRKAQPQTDSVGRAEIAVLVSAIGRAGESAPTGSREPTRTDQEQPRGPLIEDLGPSSKKVPSGDGAGPRGNETWARKWASAAAELSGRIEAALKEPRAPHPAKSAAKAGKQAAAMLVHQMGMDLLGLDMMPPNSWDLLGVLYRTPGRHPGFFDGYEDVILRLARWTPDRLRRIHELHQWPEDEGDREAAACCWGGARISGNAILVCHPGELYWAPGWNSSDGRSCAYPLKHLDSIGGVVAVCRKVALTTLRERGQAPHPGDIHVALPEHPVFCPGSKVPAEELDRRLPLEMPGIVSVCATRQDGFVIDLSPEGVRAVNAAERAARWNRPRNR